MDQETLVGSVLNDTYSIERRLGGGGMGAVFEGRHLRTGRSYAVKVLLPRLGSKHEAIARFRREAETVGRLGHAGIVGIHDFDRTPEGLTFIVMDLLDGEDVDMRLRRRKGRGLPWAEASNIAEQVGDALAAAHDLGVVHRDLKPANVFLASAPGAPERAVLLDFGLAKVMSPEPAMTQLTRTGTVMGTPQYMSPEQARGETVDNRTDIYALGVVLYEMVAGQPPFSDTTMASLFARILGDEPPPLLRERGATATPRGLDDILRRAMAKDREERFPTVRGFVDAVKALGSATTAMGMATPAVSPDTTPTIAATSAESGTIEMASAPQDHVMRVASAGEVGRAGVASPEAVSSPSVPTRRGHHPASFPDGDALPRAHLASSAGAPSPAAPAPSFPAPSVMSPSVQAEPRVDREPASLSPSRQRRRWPWVVGGLVLVLGVAALTALLLAHGRVATRGTVAAPAVESSTFSPSEPAASIAPPAPVAETPPPTPGQGGGEPTGLGPAESPPTADARSPSGGGAQAGETPVPRAEKAPAAPLVVAAQRRAAGDYRGCLRALRSAPPSRPALRLRYSCASKVGDRAEVARVCDEVRRLYPLSKAARACGGAARRRWQ